MTQWMVANKRADFEGIGHRFGIDQVTARILVNRDIRDDEEIRRFLHGRREDLHDPKLLKDADVLTNILCAKIAAGAKIRVIGDYDIDGVMSSYILLRGLIRCGACVSVAIPNRVTDGYGLNVHLIELALDDGIDTILTCDNGIAAIEEIAFAKEHGLTVLVTDHHEIPFEERNQERYYLRSNADAVVNPHQTDCPYPCKNLCGAAVAWKILVLLYEKMGIPVEEADELLENVAFATVGDIMPLMGENRILVKEGLKKISATKSVGMRALLARCGIAPEQVSCYHFGFVLGPCINAAGRLDTARRALELFMTEDEETAVTLANELVTLNEERKELTRLGVEEARRLVEAGGYDHDAVLVLFLPGVHESIAGIIAGRIREYYYRPTFILTSAENGVKGSGRSIDGYSMYEELCRCKDLLVRFGGHPMAAGVSLLEKDVDAFRQRLNENCTLTQEQLEERIHIDVPMPVDYVSGELVKEFELLGPFGRGNPHPLFADKNLSVSRMWILGRNQNVLRLTLRTASANPRAGIYFGDIPAFLDYLRQKFGSGAVEAAMNGRENPIRLSIVYIPQLNTYGGNESLQFEIKYYR